MTDNSLVKPGERLDDLGIEGFFLIQDPKQFCFGIDAVLLSHFARVKRGERVLDLCSGNGIIPVLLAAKTKAKEICGLEIQKAPWELSCRSILYNNLTNRINLTQGDAMTPWEHFDKASFDVVTVNPPYKKALSGLTNEAEELHIARHEKLCDLKGILNAASAMLRSGGRFYMVHRPLRLAEIMKNMCEAGLEPKSMRLVHPYIHKEPNLVLIEGIKDAGSELRIGSPLIVYKDKNLYTEEILEIYGIR